MTEQKTFAAPSSSPVSDVLTVDQFASMYAAAEFAAHFGVSMDSHVIINWTKMGLEEEMNSSFQAFTKTLRDFLTQRRLPIAWMYAHEHSLKTGLHTHLAISLPRFEKGRSECMEWLRSWPVRRTGKRVPGAIRLRVTRKYEPFLHWLLFHYLVKGYDRHAVVQSARYAPYGRPIMLGDLIAFHWRDPGIVNARKRVGFSQSLGPVEQAKGLPYTSTFNRDSPARISITTDSISSPLPQQPRPPFRSTFDDGVWDVRCLYGTDFCNRVQAEAKSSGKIIAEPEDCGLRPF